MTMRAELCTDLLDQVARGDATPAEAVSIVRNTMASEKCAPEDVYAALRDLTWRTLTTRAFNSELSKWFDVVRHASALAADRSDQLTAHKLRALGDLIAQSIRFADLQPPEELVKRKHSKGLLEILATAGTAVKRSVLAQRVRLADANLSRVLTALATRGLIERSASGKEASFALTELGKRTAEKLGIAVSSEIETGWWDHFPAPAAVWEGNGKPLAANALFRALDTPDPAATSLCLADWRAQVSDMAREERRLADRRLVRLGEKRWLKFVDHITPGGHRVVVADDVSEEMAELANVESCLEEARRQHASLNREKAELERRLAALQTAIHGIWTKIRDAAARSKERLHHGIQELTSHTLHVPAELQTAQEALSGMHLAMRYLDPGAAFESSPRRQVADVRQIVEEVTSVASALSGARIPVTFGNVGQVEGELSTLQSLIGQVIISEPFAALEPISLHADVQGRELHVTLKSKRADPLSYLSGSYQIASKLDHCQVFAEAYGGRVDCFIESGKDGRVAEIRIAVPLRPLQHGAGFTGAVFGQTASLSATGFSKIK